MKKFISVLLAALMLMSCFGMLSFARGERCTCPAGVHNEAGPCTCCVYCDKLDVTDRMQCYDPVADSFCCAACDGVYPCTCGCGCKFCVSGDQDISDGDSNMDDLISDQDKNNFVDGFQAVLKKISDFFDELFDTIFEFLRLDDIIGRGDEVTNVDPQN